MLRDYSWSISVQDFWRDTKAIDEKVNEGLPLLFIVERGSLKPLTIIATNVINLINKKYIMEILRHSQGFLNKLIGIECPLSQNCGLSFRMHSELKGGQFLNIVSVYNKRFKLHPLNYKAVSLTS